MTIDELSTWRNGVYRVYWKTGGTSLAAKGVDTQGRPWLAPTNWVYPLSLSDAESTAAYEKWIGNIDRLSWIELEPGEGD